MIKKIENTTQHVRLSVEDWKMFSRLYPKCLSRFIQNCVKSAILNKRFFEDCYFGDMSSFKEESIDN